jgi:hypothetical protein
LIMKEALIQSLKEIEKKHHAIRNEAEVIHHIVVEILEKLGWDVKDPSEIAHEYVYLQKRVDIALLKDDKAIALLECKYYDKNLDSFVDQIMQYAFMAGAPLAILTNGLEWRFYAALAQVDWSKRCICHLFLQQWDYDFLATTLMQFLSKDRVLLESYATEINTYALKSNLVTNVGSTEVKPKIQKVIQQIKPQVVKPASDNQIPGSDDTVEHDDHDPSEISLKSIDRDDKEFDRYNIFGFQFCDQYVYTKSWADFYSKFLSLIYQKHPDDFLRKASTLNDDIVWFSSNASIVKNPRQILQSNVWFRNRFNPRRLMGMVKDLLGLHNHSYSDLKLNLKRDPKLIGKQW